MTRKRVIAILAFAAILTLGAVAFERALRERFVGPEHSDRLADPPRFLTEYLAITKGRETLAKDGFNTNVWTLVPDSRSLSPDGRADTYFVRRPADPNSGTFTVQDPNGSRRLVHVELKGDRITSCVVRPK